MKPDADVDVAELATSSRSHCTAHFEGRARMGIPIVHSLNWERFDNFDEWQCLFPISKQHAYDHRFFSDVCGLPVLQDVHGANRMMCYVGPCTQHLCGLSLRRNGGLVVTAMVAVEMAMVASSGASWQSMGWGSAFALSVLWWAMPSSKPSQRRMIQPAMNGGVVDGQSSQRSLKVCVDESMVLVVVLGSVCTLACKDYVR